MGKYKSFIILIVISLVFTSCSKSNTNPADITVTETSKEVIEDTEFIADVNNLTGNLYLYGEKHADQDFYNKELEIWGDYYNKHGMRHLFIEMSYFTGELLNIWMQEDNDDILDEIYNDWKGTPSYTEVTYNFYKTIKSEFPETIFHGTDVGHQHKTTGERFKTYLIQNDLEGTEMYDLTIESINQGKKFYKDRDHAYRENTMAENIVREFNKLSNENAMGIYGSAHVDFESMDHYNLVPSMANQLKDIYKDRIHSVNLCNIPLRFDEIIVKDKTYQASYFGKSKLENFLDYEYREYWRLEDAYEDFKDFTFWDVLPYNNYPMNIETGQVFIIDYTKKDGTTSRMFYRSDGFEWNGHASTLGFSLDELEKMDAPSSEEMVSIGDKEYKADYYGIIDFKTFTNSESLEYWRVPDAYEDYKVEKTGDFVLLDANYPFSIEENNVYIIKLNMEDGTFVQLYMICNGDMYKGEIATFNLVIQ